MIECLAIQNIEKRLAFWCNSSSYWCVIKKSKLSESFTGLIFLEMGRVGVSFENFSTVEESSGDNVKAITFISFFNDYFLVNGILFPHCINYYFLFVAIESWKHECLINLFQDRLLHRLILLDHFWLEVFLLIECTKCLGWNGCSWSFGFLFFHSFRENVNVIIIIVFISFILRSSIWFCLICSILFLL